MKLKTCKLVFILAIVGVASAFGEATAKTTLVLQGSTSVYYPVFFRDGDWNDGPYLLNLYRGNVHLDVDWAGSMMVQIRSHSSCWGNGSDFLEYDVHSSSSAGSMIASIVRSYYDSGVVVWLRGGRTYYYDSNHGVTVRENSASGAELVVYENAQYGVHEGFATKTAVEKDFETAGRTLGNNARIAGNLNLGTAYGDPWGKWIAVGNADYSSYPLYLGTNRYGTGTVWDSDGIFVGLSDEGGNRKDAVIAWGDDSDDTLRFLFNGKDLMRLTPAGNLGIGTTNPTEKLSVNGKIRAKEVIVETTGWSDHVFSPNYKLAPLSEVARQIEQQGHLPGVPSAQDVAEKGVSVGDMQAILLAKIEELTLHQIAQEKRINALEAENAQLKAQSAKTNAGGTASQ